MIEELIAAPKEGLNLRPPGVFLRLLHMAREIAVTVALRPVSMGNQGYLAERIEDMNALGKELADRAPALNSAWAEVSSNLGKRLQALTLQDAANISYDVVSVIDQTQYKRFWYAEGACLPAWDFPLLKRQYKKLVLITGPGLGLGDELACAEAVRGLRRRCASAELNVYTYYPGLWHHMEPDSVVFGLSRNPLAAFRAVEELTARGEGEGTLVLFANFVGCDFHLSFLGEQDRPDVAEIAVGKGTLWWAQRDATAVVTAPLLDPIYPNHYDTLRELLDCLIGHPRVKSDVIRSREKPLPGKDEFKILLNPLTSKAILFEPEDWVALVKTALSAVPEHGRVVCTIIPGLGEQAVAYSGKILEYARKEKKDFEMRLLTGGKKKWNSETAIGIVAAEMSESDLMLGVDTYTSHLAALNGVPSVSFCNWRTAPFWSDQSHSWWIEFLHGFDALSDLTTLMLSLQGVASASKRDWDRNNPWAKDAVALSRAVPADGGGRREPKLLPGPWIKAGNAAWESHSARTQGLFERMDEGYAWPQLREAIESSARDQRTLRWILKVFRHTHFWRISAFAAVTRERRGLT